jgi:hypothetical protein
MSQTNASKPTEVDTYYPSWLPYPGDKKQIGTTLLAHAHVGLVFRGIFTTTLHYLDTFVRDARVNVASQGGTTLKTTGLTPDASIQVYGIDFRLNGGWMGDGYLGYSHVKASNANSVADSLELLHSQGGWQLAHNYFYDGNGSIDTIGGQYTFSLASFMMRPRPFWGQGADLSLTGFFMYNKITGTGKDAAEGQTIPKADTADMSKLKWGIDAIYSFSPMVAVGLRGDLVNPNMSDSTQSFQVISPKVMFRSEFVTHEMVTLQFSYYNYGSAYTDMSNPDKLGSVMPWPYGTYGTLDLRHLGANGAAPPDKYVVTLSASMWW